MPKFCAKRRTIDLEFELCTASSKCKYVLYFPGSVATKLFTDPGYNSLYFNKLSEAVETPPENIISKFFIAV